MLEKLLVRSQSYDIDTKESGITNHLPMVLIALHRLGASDERLQEYFQFYSKKLKRLEYPAFIGQFNWLDHLGEKDKFAAYLDFYSSQICLHGTKVTLNAHIGKLIQGCAASAFHALIRLSYGILQNNAKEIAFGLAHMSSHFLEIPASLNSDKQPSELLKNALKVFSGYTAIGDSVTKRMLDISNHSKFVSVNLYPSDLSLRCLTSLFSQLYLQSSNFTILHAVTSCHAMRVLLPYVKDKDAAISAYWSAILVAVLSIKDLNLSDITDTNFKPVDKLSFENALESNDDHFIKLVFSCLEEYEYYNDINHSMILNSKLGNVM